MVAALMSGTAVASVPVTTVGPAADRNRKMPHVLTVAGSDSGAGAGIQADIKACGALGAYCSSVITAVTAQNTVGVQGVHPVPEEFVKEQLKSVLSDMNVDVVKTGMLPSVGIVNVLCNSLREFPVQALVVDPVMVSTSGDMLAAPSTLAKYRDELLPMADIVTPNLKEASALLGGVLLETVADMHSAAKAIHSFGPRITETPSRPTEVKEPLIEVSVDLPTELTIGLLPSLPAMKNTIGSVFRRNDLSRHAACILLELPLTAVVLSQKSVPPPPSWLKYDTLMLVTRPPT